MRKVLVTEVNFFAKIDEKIENFRFLIKIKRFSMKIEGNFTKNIIKSNRNTRGSATIADAGKLG